MTEINVDNPTDIPTDSPVGTEIGILAQKAPEKRFPFKSASKKIKLMMVLLVCVFAVLAVMRLYGFGISFLPFIIGFFGTQTSEPIEDIIILPNRASDSGEMVTISHKDAIPQEILDTAIVYKYRLSDQTDETEILMQTASATSAATKIGNCEVFGLSSSRKRVAYITKDTNGIVSIYSFSTGETISVTDPHPENARRVTWSPDGQYILVDHGTSAEGYVSILRYPDGTFIDYFPLSNEKIEWINDTEFFFDQPEEVSKEIPVETGRSSSIKRYSLITKQAQTIKKGTETSMYTVYDVKDGSLRYIENRVDAFEDWMEPTTVKTMYRQIDTDGKNEREMDQDVGARASLSGLPDPYNTFRIKEMIPHHRMKDWSLIGFYDESKHATYYAIANTQDVAGTFTTLWESSMAKW